MAHPMPPWPKSVPHQYQSDRGLKLYFGNYKNDIVAIETKGGPKVNSTKINEIKSVIKPKN